MTYTTSSVILFLYQLFVSIWKGFITRSLGLKRSQEFSYAQQAAGTSGFFYFAGNCIYFENEHKRHSLFLCLNAGKGGLRKQMIPELSDYFLSRADISRHAFSCESAGVKGRSSFFDYAVNRYLLSRLNYALYRPVCPIGHIVYL